MSGSIVFATNAPISGGGVGPYLTTPANIFNSALVGEFDAEDTGRSLLNSSGNPVSDGEAIRYWACKRQSCALDQTDATAQPIFDINGLNGRPCAVFDGTNDRMTFTGVPSSWPTGTDEGEIWAIIENSVVDSDTQQRRAFGYGGQTSPTGRALTRNRASAQSRFAITDGGGGPQGLLHWLNEPFSLMAEFYTESATQYIGGYENDISITRVARTFSTATTIVVMGASTQSANTTNFGGKINGVWILNRRSTTEERTAMRAFINARLA